MSGVQIDSFFTARFDFLSLVDSGNKCLTGCGKKVNQAHVLCSYLSPFLKSLVFAPIFSLE